MRRGGNAARGCRSVHTRTAMRRCRLDPLRQQATRFFFANSLVYNGMGWRFLDLPGGSDVIALMIVFELRTRDTDICVVVIIIMMVTVLIFLNWKVGNARL